MGMKRQILAILSITRIAYAQEVDKEVDDQLNYCIRPITQYGQYSSYDGGKSAVAILDKCQPQASAWMKSCKSHGGDDQTCGLQIAITVQLALKMFNK